jgi:GNAT superfamily N-acetyltransferase
MMKSSTDWRAVSELVVSCRNEGRAVTNFFPDEERMAAWCRDGTFFEECHGDTQFLIRRQNAFANVYFMGRSVETLGRDWKLFVASNGSGRWIVDLIGPDRVRQPMENAFKSVGFARLTTLQRMGRKTPEEIETGAGRAVAPRPSQRAGGCPPYLGEYATDVECATAGDVGAIKCLLDTYFVAEEEQIPSAEEIGKWIEKQTIYVVRGNAGDPILGFVILDLSPATLYLRYWFVHPSVRGKGVGGRLLKSMFAAGCDTKRQYFWVKTDNDNAINRYQHYGFQFEPLKDVVMELTV